MINRNTGSKVKSTSQSLTMILLLVLIIAASVGIYHAVNSMGRERATASTGPILGKMFVEEVIPVQDEERPDTCVLLGITVRNNGKDPLPLHDIRLYIYIDETLAQVMDPVITYNDILMPGETQELVFSTSRGIGPGKIVLKISGRYSISDLFKYELPCTLAPTVHSVLTIANTRHNPKVIELGGVMLEIWVEYMGEEEGYAIHARPSYQSQGLGDEAELWLGIMNVNGKHARPYLGSKQLELRLPDGVCDDMEKARNDDDDEEDERHYHGKGYWHLREHEEEGREGHQCYERDYVVWRGIEERSFPFIVIVSRVG